MTEEIKLKHKNKIFCHRYDERQGIIFHEKIADEQKIKELKEGEQIRIPIDIKRAEKI